MVQRTATEKDMFLDAYEREGLTTLKLLRAFPPHKADFKPHERSRSARELAWTFVHEQRVATAMLEGDFDFTRPVSEPPADFNEIITGFEKAVRDTLATVGKVSEQDLNGVVRFPLGPGTTGEIRRLDVLWNLLLDQVHHRGQFSVYLRLAGAKVPSIYGPTADEPWT